MLGISREGRGVVLASRKTLVIEQAGAGALILIATVGRGSAVFRMIRQDANSIEFANPSHDYPQRIRYWREGDTLHAEISLLDGSNANRWTYAPMGT